MWIVAHRGASGYAPENTMAAFNRAVELGARFIETDLQLTRDAGVFALHDHTLDRTTTGQGPAHLRSSREICVLDAGSWFGAPHGESFAGERVPSLAQILQFARERDVIFYLEIKADAAWGLEHAVVAALEEAREAARVVLISFDAARIETVRQLDGSMMTGYLFDEPAEDVVERTVRLGARQMLPRSDLVTKKLVDAAHEAGLQVVTWTLNDTAVARDLAALGVDGIMTDYPDRLAAALPDHKF